MASAPQDFVKQIEGDGEGLKTKLKKTNTAEKTWTPTAEGAFTALVNRVPVLTFVFL